jgi:phosphoribosylformylglycinamidine synthase II
MDYRIVVSWRSDGSRASDGRIADLLSQLAHLPVPPIARVEVSNLYFLRGDLTPDQVDRVAAELLADPVVERYSILPLAPEGSPGGSGVAVVEVGYRPGVTDAAAAHLLQRARMLCGGQVEAAATGMRYLFEGTDLSADDLHCIAREVLCNEVVQTYALGALMPAFLPYAAPSDVTEVVALCDADDATLARISVERVLFLSLAEMRVIRDEFRALGRDPTDVELETLAQTWSEHCQHKTFKGRIQFTRPDGVTETIDGLLRSTIRAATEKLARPWVRSAFVDNAGIVDFDEDWEVSFKVETHNHPSALEPFGGANTGVGGVIRDIIGVSARPIANTDVLCFGPLDARPEELPTGILHPRRIARGVVAGIEDYGNKMGIPTVSGAILYDPDYAANPLVFCGCVGLAPRGVHPRAAQPGDLCVALGGRTGRDGIHGATFSSAELTHETGQTVGSVVQIGDPITEKAMLEAILRARDEHLYTAITDCGAGGFSSAVGEMGARIGVEVELSDVPLKYPGLRPWEIWLSEAQERMVLAVPPENLPRLREICGVFEVELTVIGRFTGDGRLRVHHKGRTVADLDMRFLHEGWPRPNLRAEWVPPFSSSPAVEAALGRVPADLTGLLLRMLAHPDVASKEPVIRRYDHEVQGATAVRPLVGPGRDGPSDAAVLRPLDTRGPHSLALGCGINPHYGRLDPYAMAWAVVDEAVRNVVCVGADPEHIALLDNFCWGNPGLPDRLGALVRAAQGCHDAALAYRTPFISGKDSLNNEYVDRSGGKRAIPPTLLISSLGIVPDVERAVTMDLKAPGDVLYIVGETRAELGGSLYARLVGVGGLPPPAPLRDPLPAPRALHRAMQAGLVRACHDASEGGLAVAVAEMALAGRLGLTLDLALVPCSAGGGALHDVVALFAESSGRFLVEVAPEDAPAFERTLAGCPLACLGRVSSERALRVRGLGGQTVLECAVDDLVRAWQGTEVV